MRHWEEKILFYCIDNFTSQNYLPSTSNARTCRCCSFFLFYVQCTLVIFSFMFAHLIIGQKVEQTWVEQSEPSPLLIIVDMVACACLREFLESHYEAWLYCISVTYSRDRFGLHTKPTGDKWPRRAFETSFIELMYSWWDAVPSVFRLHTKPKNCRSGMV